jgi:hypothetical protein
MKPFGDPGLRSALFAVAISAVAGFGGPASAAAAVAASVPNFLNSLGINAHISLAQGPYADVYALSGKLSYLGINHVREDVRNTTASIARYQVIGGAGNKLTLMLSPKVLPSPTAATSAFDSISSYIDTLEGTNEINVTPVTYGGYTGVPAAQAWQRAIWSAAKGDSHFATNSAVAQFTYGPVIANPAGTGLADYSNAHIYVLSQQPPFVTVALDSKLLGVPKQSVYVTEFNYPTSTDTYKGVTEDIQAKYTADGIFDCFMVGFKRVYIYELMDEGTDITNREDNFGVFRYDGSAKPLATELHNLTQILAASGTAPTPFTPGSLSFSIAQTLTLSYMDANLYHYLMQGQNGTFYLVIWAEPPLFNVSPPTPHPVTIAFPSPHSSVQVYDPMVGSTPINTYSSTNSVVVTTVDHPIILAISNN